jgi:AmiR/NasT family two-component response regulator
VALVAAGEIDNLQRALSGRTVIGQATGLLMTEYALTDDEAFELLRRLSMDENIKLAEVARRVVAGHNEAVHEQRGSGSV